MKKKLLEVTNDYVFRRIFGEVGNEEITKDLLEKVLNVKYNKINLSKNPILLPEQLDGKTNILDVSIEAEENENINIEMQVAKYDYMIERILEYWARKYLEVFKRGNDYGVAKRTICILIASFEIDKLKNIERFHTQWNLREKNYLHEILTDKIEFHIINLRKLEYINEEKELLNWCKFIQNPETLGEEAMENENIKKAKTELEKMSQDEIERDMAYRRERAIRDYNAIRNYGYKEGREEGIKDGKKEGIKEGAKKAQENIAKNMLREGMPIDMIANLTNLSKEEIEKLK